MRWRSSKGALRSIYAAAAAGVLVALLVAAPAAFAGEAPPDWRIESRPSPTNLPLEGHGIVILTVSDLGGSANGEAHEVQITDHLPAGVELDTEAKHPVEPKVLGTPRDIKNNLRNSEHPKGFGCAQPPPGEPVVCTFGQELFPYEQFEVFIYVKTHFHERAEPVNEVTVTGGGAPEATLARALKVNGQKTEFGVEQYELTPETIAGEEGNEAIVPDTQAGSHPYQLTTTFNLNQRNVAESYGPPSLNYPAPALQRNLNFRLPAGLIGDPNAVAQCRGGDFGASFTEGANGCPADTAIGVAQLNFFEPNALGNYFYVVPIFNLVPAPGEPARFGFVADHVPVVLDTSVATGGDYAVTVSVHNASQAIGVLGSRVTIWGAPEDPSHDEARGWACLGYPIGKPCEKGGVAKPSAFLTLPTSCATTPTTSVTGESWPREEANGEVVVGKIGNGPGEASENMTYEFPSKLTGCGLLGFEPALSVEPGTQEANTPTELTTRVTVNQQTALEVGKLAPSTIKDTTVEFPQGVLLNPAAANGLQACLEGESESVEGVGSGGIGFAGNRELGEGFEGTSPTFTETLPEPLVPGVNFCANASKVGEVHIKTPDLANELVGGVYTAAQNANPFGSLFAIYIVAQDPVSKVLVKLAGEVKLNPTTGQITTTFANTPDVPFEELTLRLFGGEKYGKGRATLTTPPECGAVGPTVATFTAWASEPGQGPRTHTDDAPGFNPTSGPEGTACASPQPLTPSFVAGSSNTQAGAFSPFEVTINHPDADQPLTGLTTTLPPGLAAVIASVTPCKEPAASQGTCGPESEIGTAEASVGLGGEPFVQKEGKLFLTGPYDGAPFGLSVVVPANAGPFKFGNVVTRSTITINEETAAVTITSPLPTMVNTTLYPEGVGVPVQLKSLHVVVGREHFQFNPTNCSPMSIGATLKGEDNVSYPYQVHGCENLAFAPKFGISVAGQGSKAGGVGFTATLESGGIGVEGIRKVFLTVPKILPARLQPTLQNACLDKVFVVNPAGCPEDSFIGTATVQTPVLKTPLTGPAILVSHGNAAFPDVEFVLQSENIHILLDGKTDIKKGVTYSRFESAPDAPFTKFISEFPAGPHSIFTDNTEEASTYNLCGKSIVAPTEITAQDGRVIKQETNLTVSGCVKTPALTRAQKLAKALKACKKDKKKSKRQACERAARKKYGAKSKKHTKKKAAKKKLPCTRAVAAQRGRGGGACCSTHGC